jgi:hypothetical protein
LSKFEHGEGHDVQVGAPTEEEVKDWAWYSNVQDVDDEVIRIIGGKHISFAFTLHVPGCPVQEACGIIPDGKGAQGAQAMTKFGCGTPIDVFFC